MRIWFGHRLKSTRQSRLWIVRLSRPVPGARLWVLILGPVYVSAFWQRVR